MDADALGREIAELGLEDDIPLWELADHCRAKGVITSGTAGVEALEATLFALASKGVIRVRVGSWDSPELRDVYGEEAKAFLLDHRRYSSDEETALGLERVYYVNVNNILE